METAGAQQAVERCPIVHSLSIVGRKWILPIICELNKAGVLRYLELKKRLDGVTNMALTKALKELADRGLVNRVQFNEIPPHTEYSLTEEGKALLPNLYGLAQWGLGQMDPSASGCICSERCYAVHHVYIPPNREPEVKNYPQIYNERYRKYFDEIRQKMGPQADPLLLLEEFLVAILYTLIEDGQDMTRWSMTFFFRQVTPDITPLTQGERPQYLILCKLINQGRKQGRISVPLETAYLADQLSKVITGMVGEWQMANCSYDVIAYNRPMLHWLCQSLASPIVNNP